MKTMTIGALSLVALAFGAAALHAQPLQKTTPYFGAPALEARSLQNTTPYSGPAVLLAAEDHAERLLPGNPASRALDLSVWQEEEIAAIREGQRAELGAIASDSSLTPAERRASTTEVVKAKGILVSDVLTFEQRGLLAGWVRQERDRVDMILGENLVERLQPFSWLSTTLGVTDAQLKRVASIRERQRVDIGIINGLEDLDPEDVKDRMNAMFLRHGEAVRAMLSPSQISLLDAMWSERY